MCRYFFCDMPVQNGMNTQKTALEVVSHLFLKFCSQGIVCRHVKMLYSIWLAVGCRIELGMSKVVIMSYILIGYKQRMWLYVL
jgi:hypothetical protein